MGRSLVAEASLQIWTKLDFLGLELRLKSLLHLKLYVLFLLVGVRILVLHVNEIAGGHLVAELALVTLLAIAVVLEKFANWELLLVIYV